MNSRLCFAFLLWDENRHSIWPLLCCALGIIYVLLVQIRKFFFFANEIITFQVSEVYSKELKGAISALASLQGHLLIASGPKIILHKWTGTELNGVAFFDAPPLYVVSLNIVCISSST